MKNLESWDEERLNLELPVGLRRQLARMSVNLNTDLQSLIRSILEGECS